jgi:hypothetical protein
MKDEKPPVGIEKFDAALITHAYKLPTLIEALERNDFKDYKTEDYPKNKAVKILRVYIPKDGNVWDRLKVLQKIFERGIIKAQIDKTRAN